MKRYWFDTDELDFDFYSTTPPVFEIVVEQSVHYHGWFARATFRGRPDSHLYGLVAWGIDEDKALAELFVQLGRYVPDSCKTCRHEDYFEDGHDSYDAVVPLHWVRMCKAGGQALIDAVWEELSEATPDNRLLQNGVQIPPVVNCPHWEEVG